VSNAVAAHENSRGQTLPFWVLSVLLSFALVFFVFNYTNTMRYQVRAQNAADSAAVAALAQDANAINSVQTLMYALSVQELTIRGINAATNKILGDTNVCPHDASGAPDLVHAGTCLTNLTTLVNEYATATSQYDAVFNQLTSASASLATLATNTGQNPNNAVKQFFTNNCLALNTDCSFVYTTQVDAAITTATPLTITETACKTVQTTAADFLMLRRPSFYALGRTKVTLAPVLVSSTTGSLNGTGLGAQSKSRDLLPGTGGYSLDLSNLNVTTGYVQPASAGPSSDPVDFSTECSS